MLLGVLLLVAVVIGYVHCRNNGNRNGHLGVTTTKEGNMGKAVRATLAALFIVGLFVFFIIIPVMNGQR